MYGCLISQLVEWTDLLATVADQRHQCPKLPEVGAQTVCGLYCRVMAPSGSSSITAF